MEAFLTQLQTVPPLAVYFIVFAIAFVENIFPPSPSDLAIVFAGALASSSHVGLIEAFASATCGSTLGFLAMYKIGDWFGNRILEQGKLKFISVQAVEKVESWFRRYGYWLIVANRFLSGTRAVVSFFAGMSELHLARTVLLCFVSASAWNIILLLSGYYFGKNWQQLGFYLSTYSQIVTGIIIVAAIVFAVRFFYKRRNGPQGQ